MSCRVSGHYWTMNVSEVCASAIDGQAVNDRLHNSGIKRCVAYVASLEYIQKCDCLPKVKGRVVYTEHS